MATWPEPKTNSIRVRQNQRDSERILPFPRVCSSAVCSSFPRNYQSPLTCPRLSHSCALLSSPDTDRQAFLDSLTALVWQTVMKPQGWQNKEPILHTEHKRVLNTEHKRFLTAEPACLPLQVDWQTSGRASSSTFPFPHTFTFHIWQPTKDMMLGNVFWMTFKKIFFLCLSFSVRTKSETITDVRSFIYLKHRGIYSTSQKLHNYSFKGPDQIWTSHRHLRMFRKLGQHSTAQ